MNQIIVATANLVKETSMRIVFETPEPDDPSVPDDDSNGDTTEEESE